MLSVIVVTGTFRVNLYKRKFFKMSSGAVDIIFPVPNERTFTVSQVLDGGAPAKCIK